MPATERLNIPRSERALGPDAADLEEAREAIAKLLLADVHPQVTVPKEHLAKVLKEGLRPRETAYQKNVRALIGTLGRPPFLPQGEDRYVLEILIDDPKKLSPRFTGPKHAFQGVVEIKSEIIPPEQIKLIQPGSAENAA